MDKTTVKCLNLLRAVGVYGRCKILRGNFLEIKSALELLRLINLLVNSSRMWEVVWLSIYLVTVRTVESTQFTQIQTQLMTLYLSMCYLLPCRI